MNAVAQELLNAHLWRDEEILWSAQPIAANPVAAHAARRAFLNGLGGAIGSSFVGVYLIAKFTSGFGVGMFELVLIAAVFGTLVFAVWTAVRGWFSGRRLAGRTVYAITNRRVVVVQGDQEFWIGRREIAKVSIRGGDISIRRHLTDAEQRQSRDSAWDERLGDKIEIGTREVVLAAVPEPNRVLDLLQTPQDPSAS